jgi:hypothetical protein
LSEHMLNITAGFAVLTLITLCAVPHPGWRLLIITLLAAAAYLPALRSITNAADACADKRRRARRGTGTLLASMLLTSCREEAPLTPEPEPAAADITSIECTGTCSITTAGPSTLVWIQE